MLLTSAVGRNLPLGSNVRNGWKAHIGTSRLPRGEMIMPLARGPSLHRAA